MGSPPPSARGLFGCSAYRAWLRCARLTPTTSPWSVMIVEDDPITRQRLARAIEANASLRLAAAVGGCAAAREALRREIPSVLLVDIGLPDGSGIYSFAKSQPGTRAST